MLKSILFALAVGLPMSHASATIRCEGITSLNITNQSIKTNGQIEILKDGHGTFVMSSTQGRVNGVYTEDGFFTASLNNFYKIKGQIIFSQNKVSLIGSNLNGSIQFKVDLECETINSSDFQF